MKNNYNKSLKQTQNYRLHGSGNKRSPSPIENYNQRQATQNNKSNSQKKIANSPYQKAMKDFQSYGKSTKRKTPHEKQKVGHKFRIVTEPVDDRIMHLAQGNIFNSSLAVVNPPTCHTSSKKKMQIEIKESQGIRLNLRQNSSQSRSKDKAYSSKNINLYSNNNSKSHLYSRKTGEQSLQNQVTRCKNCARYSEELEYLNLQIRKMIKMKNQWKIGEAAFDQIKHVFNYNSENRERSQSKNKLKNKNHEFMFADAILKEIKTNLVDLIKDIETLSSIDYPKMLSMDIFTYEPMYEGGTDSQQTELKDLLGQLRLSIEGKTIDYDTFDTQSQNSYTKMIMRNMKSRLSQTLRDNLQLKIKIAILQKSEQISEESEEYLRIVIEEVIANFCRKKV